MKKLFAIFILLASGMMACNSGNSEEQEKFKEETIKMDSLSQDLDESIETLEKEVEEDLHDVDSLLEGME
ncbi:hypothetical protein GYB22_07770 [bacterium]|nr:hypothetical protein [bacterium]